MKTRDLLLTSIVASLYFVLGFLFQSIAFGQVQVRVADALYPLISLGSPFLIGTFLGHFLFNLYGFSTGLALGLGDLLSPFLFLVPKLLIWRYGKSRVLLFLTVLVHVITVALWVSFLLETLFGVPQWASAPLIFLGNS